jgi:dienelactone hydrolase
MRRAALLLITLALAGCGGEAADETSGKDDPVAAQAAGLFAYDPAAPLDVTEGETVDDVAYSIVGMSFRSTGGDRVSGIVVRPRLLRPGAAGVIFMHGSGGTRADFLDEAVMLASRGAVAMTIDSPWSRSPREEVRAGYADDETTRRLMVTNVRDLRRGFDVLVDHYDVDPARLAVVGYSMGVQAAGLAASLDPRVKAVVLMAGRAHPSGPEGQRQPVFEQLDTVRFVPHLAPAHVLLQGGTKDTVIGRPEMEQLYKATSEPKEIRWYPAGHGLGLRSQRDRIAWLSRQLALG